MPESDDNLNIERIESLITQGKTQKAQELLNSDASISPAHRHYLRAKIFLKQDWYLSGKLELEEAVKLEPDNPRYRAALDYVVSFIGNPQVNPESLGNFAPKPLYKKVLRICLICGGFCGGCAATVFVCSVCYSVWYDTPCPCCGSGGGCCGRPTCGECCLGGPTCCNNCAERCGGAACARKCCG